MSGNGKGERPTANLPGAGLGKGSNPAQGGAGVGEDPASAELRTGKGTGPGSAACADAQPAPVLLDRSAASGGAEAEAAVEERTAPRLPTLEMRFRSVIDFVGTVNDAITGKVLPRPELMDFNGWKSWRSNKGKRPTVSRGARGTQVFTTAKEETIFWKHAMQLCYGTEWKTALQRKKVSETVDMELQVQLKEEAERAELARLASIEGGQSVTTVAMAKAPRFPRIPGSPGGLSSQASLPGSPRGLKLEALQYNPEKQTVASYETKLIRIAGHLEELGEAFSDEDKEELLASASYLHVLRNGLPPPVTPGDEVKYLKTEVAKLLCEEC